MDLKAYQSQIQELIPLRNEPDFNELLNNILFGESKSDKFLIKMELSRLAKPCQRILDIRDKVTEECILFEQEGLKHYLTKATITVLQNNINLYGQYTVGVFEAVLQHITDQKIKVQAQKNLPTEQPERKEQCELLALSQKNKRGAPRMFFVSDVNIKLSDSKIIKAQTSNISLTGVKLKLSDDVHINDGEIIDVTFTGLELEYGDNVLKETLAYQIVKQKNEGDGFCYLYLNYIGENSHFSTFISEFIRLNQYKYKIDVQYYYQIAKISALKHSYLSQMNTLPLYLDANSATPLLFSLTNNTNKQLLHEWYCEGVEQLPLLFNELRLIKLLVHARVQASTTLYTFTHTAKGKQYFLCATEEELLDIGLKETFINYGRSKHDWRVYHLTLIPYQYQSTNRYDITEPIPKIFKKITHKATLQRLTKAYPFALSQDVDKTQVNTLNQFVHRSATVPIKLPCFALFPDEHRKEARYLYHSNLSISDGKNHYNGHMIDFSFSGLKIKLEKISTFSSGTSLHVSFIDLQKVSEKHALSQLSYKIIKTGAGNVLHLQVHDAKTLDICQRFFSLLVKNNAQHFTCLPLNIKPQPISKRLVEIAEESFNDCVFFITREAGRPKIKYAAIEETDHPLHSLFSFNSDNKNELNYYPLANNQLYERLISQPFKEMTEKVVHKEALIYVKAVKNKNNEWQINSFLDEDFKSETEKIAFIKECQLSARFYAFHFRLSTLPAVNLDNIKTEIRAISRFALHLTKKLEEELQAVEALIEITDRSTYIINAVNNKH